MAATNGEAYIQNDAQKHIDKNKVIYHRIREIINFGFQTLEKSAGQKI